MYHGNKYIALRLLLKRLHSFTTDENGNYIFVYHSRSKECYEGKCGYGTEDPLYDPCRSARIRTVQWDGNGLPVLNQ